MNITTCPVIILSTQIESIAVKVVLECMSSS